MSKLAKIKGGGCFNKMVDWKILRNVIRECQGQGWGAEIDGGIILFILISMT